MSNDLTVFNFGDFQVRTIIKEGEPWFVAKDVCDILSIQNARDTVKTVLYDEEKGVDKIYTLGGEQSVTIVNESGLYTLIIRSNKPDAKRFRKWVTSEVLPTIRKTGSFPVETMTKRDWIAKALELEDQRIALANQIEEQKPDVEFARDFKSAKGAELVGDFAKRLGIKNFGEVKLWSWLREQGICDDKNKPY